MPDLYTLITGASEGFGKALAFECASRNMNIIIVALPGSGLNDLACCIRRNFKIDVIVIEKDLSSEQNCMALFSEISSRHLQMNMLINNAGIGGSLLFLDGSIQFFQRQIKLNVLATTLITHLFLETLQTHSKSYILNVGSLSCFFAMYMKQVYGGTKSYIYSFSKSLRMEVRDRGVGVSVVCPGGMNTNISTTSLNKSGAWLHRLAVMNPEDVAPIAINGLLKGREVIIPGRLNRIFLMVNKVLPGFLKEMLITRQMKICVTSQKNYKIACSGADYSPFKG